MKNSQRPAFANMPSHTDPQHTIGEYGGLTKREYACIKLGIPETGDPELDELIRKAERKRIAAIAMQGILAAPDQYNLPNGSKDVAKDSLDCADELLKQLENESK